MRNFIFFLGLFLFSCEQKAHFKNSSDKKTILTILAHPDDESAVGQVLASLARQGNKVYLLLASDGRYGVEKHYGLPAGDSLVKIRKHESVCASKILGIEPPVFLNFHDGLGIVTGLGEYFDQTIQIKEELKIHIEKINPDLIITFGPDGDTGHPDHRGISDLTTEVILREGWYEKYPLYYIGWLKEKVVSIAQGQLTSLNYTNQKYLNVRLKYNEEDRNKLFQSLNCYQSQFTPEDVSKWIEAEKKDSSFTFYFRRFTTDTIQANSF